MYPKTDPQSRPMLLWQEILKRKSYCSETKTLFSMIQKIVVVIGDEILIEESRSLSTKKRSIEKNINERLNDYLKYMYFCFYVLVVDVNTRRMPAYRYRLLCRLELTGPYHL